MSALLAMGVLVPLSPSWAAAVPTCQGEPTTIVGTAKADTLTGTPGPDVIVGRGGNDVIRGRGGDDLICGGAGADELHGGGGADRLYGEADEYVDNRGDTRWTADVLDGGPGDDLLDVGGNEGSEPGYGAEGVIDYRGADAGVTVDLAAGTATGQGEDTILAPPAPVCGDCYSVAVYGSEYDDVLLGSEAQDFLRGFAGDDRIDGRGGDDSIDGDLFWTYDELLSEPLEPQTSPDADVLIGGAGDDHLASRWGRDILRGGDGSDSLRARSAAPSQVYGEGGDDWQLVVAFSRRPGFVLDGGPGDDDGQLMGPLEVGGGGRPSAAQVRMGAGVVAAEGVDWGAIGGTESLLLGTNIRWDYRGTDEREQLESHGIWLHARMRGGNDAVWGTDGPDRINAGAGTDRVYAGAGRDRCIDAETVDSCEVRS